MFGCSVARLREARRRNCCLFSFRILCDHTSIAISTAEQGAFNRVQHHVEVLAYVFSEEAQHEITVLLQQLVLAAVSRYASVLSRWCAPSIRSQCARQRIAGRLPFDPNCRTGSAIRHSSESAPRCRQGLQAPIDKCLRRASCAISAFCTGHRNSHGVDKEASELRVHPVSNQPFDTRGVVALPLGVGGQGDIRGPSRTALAGTTIV